MLKLLTSDKALHFLLLLPSFNLVASWHCICDRQGRKFGTGSRLWEKAWLDKVSPYGTGDLLADGLGVLLAFFHRRV